MADASGTLLLDVANRAGRRKCCRRPKSTSDYCPRFSNRRKSAPEFPRKARQPTGLRTGTPVVAGAGDQAAGASRHGHRRARRGERHDRHIGRSLRCNGSSCARTPRTPAYVLSCNTRGLARNGCDPGCRTFAALVPRSVRMRKHGGARDPYERLTVEAATVPPGCKVCCGLRILWASARRISIPMRVPRWSALPLTHARAHHSRHSRRRRIQPARYVHDFRRDASPGNKIRLGGGGARSHSGGRSRRTFTGTKLKSSKRRKAQHTARQFCRRRRGRLEVGGRSLRRCGASRNHPQAATRISQSDERQLRRLSPRLSRHPRNLRVVAVPNRWRSFVNLRDLSGNRLRTSATIKQQQSVHVL